jgi:Polyketide cyclase / dehydrase and lipid transport
VLPRTAGAAYGADQLTKETRAIKITASATVQFQAPPEEIFQVATSLSTLGGWLRHLENIRAIGDDDRASLGVEFLADETLADNPRETNHRFRVTSREPPRSFGFRGLDESGFEGQLLIERNGNGSNVTWSFSATPTSLAERIMTAIMRTSVQKQADRQAKGQLESLGRLVPRA